MKEHNMNERENEVMRTETIIKKVFDHSSEQMLLCYIGEAVKVSLD